MCQFYLSIGVACIKTCPYAFDPLLQKFVIQTSAWNLWKTLLNGNRFSCPNVEKRIAFPWKVSTPETSKQVKSKQPHLPSTFPSP